MTLVVFPTIIFYDLVPALDFASGFQRHPKATLFLRGAQKTGRISDLLKLGYTVKEAVWGLNTQEFRKD